VKPCSGSCTDEEGCVAIKDSFAAEFHESSYSQSTNTGIGAWLRENHNAHSIVMPCMDLDAHLGNTEMYGMPFRGAVIFEATIKDLVATQGLGEGGGKHLLVMHGSSGSNPAVMHHLDKIVGYAGDLSNVYPLGLLDSGSGNTPCAFVSDKDSCKAIAEESDDAASSISSHRESWDWMYDNFYKSDWAGDAASDECAAAFPGEENFCMYTDYKLQYVKAAAINLAYKFEEHLFGQSLPSLTVTKNNCDQSSLCDTAVAIGDYEEESLLNSGMDKNGKGLYLSNCWTHSAAKYESTFYTMEAGGSTMEEAIEQFIWRGNSDWTKGVATDPDSFEGLVFADSPSCTGFSCGTCADDCGGAKAACMMGSKGWPRRSFWSLEPTDGPTELAKAKAKAKAQAKKAKAAAAKAK